MAFQSICLMLIPQCKNSFSAIHKYTFDKAQGMIYAVFFQKEDTTQGDGNEPQQEPVDSNTVAEQVEEEPKPVPIPVPKRSRPGGYPCKQCDRVLMSMQGLRSHERSHLALALFTREGKYNCQFCSFVSAFRHK